MLFQFRAAASAIISTLLFMSVNQALFSQDSGPAAAGDIYLLRNGRIIHIAGTDPEELNLNGDVTAVFTADSGVYYVRHDDQGYTAGFYTPGPAGSGEYQVLHQSYTVERFIVSEKIIYILFKKPGELAGSGSNELLRINPATGLIDTVDQVSDFGLVRGTVFILRGREIQYNGGSIPLMIEGDMHVRAVVDDRLVLVGSGEETEVCDVVEGRNIYQYSGTGSFPVNEEYNLVFEFADTGVSGGASDPDGSMVYYNIIINGYEDERTETAPGRVTKTSYLLLDPGRSYLVRVERWELDRVKGKYVRANNVMQPGELKVFVPENRGLKIIVEFTGSGYNIRQGVYRGNEK
ncbi:MAG TPA: hypothetical protein PK514_05100 [Spirochaetota bacterium]|nr:hypothetical protein [Spirochaetota bacterium]